jgi:hypothetical protein
MIRTAALASAALLFAAAPAMAQASKVEVSANVGWVISDGVTGTAVKALDGNTYNELDAKDSIGYHFTVGLHASPHLLVGFLYGRQESKLQAKGSATKEIGDMNIDNYHVFFEYDLGGQSAVVKPFLYGGLGSTKYGDVNFTQQNVVNPNFTEHTIPGQTRFSTTWGAGVKIYPTKVVGFRAEMRWVPTYIKSDAAGWWCDPFWGCYVVGSAQYSNQLDFSGGVTLRF